MGKVFTTAGFLNQRPYESKTYEQHYPEINQIKG